MKALTVGAVRKAARRAAGVKATADVRVGHRADRRFQHSAYTETGNVLFHHSDALPIGDLGDVCPVHHDDLQGPCVLDLYVYTGSDGHHATELETNVAVVISADGELLDCFDSTTKWERLAWWLAGSECQCKVCSGRAV